MKRFSIFFYIVFLGILPVHSQYVVLHNFGSSPGDGTSPYGSLVLSENKLYGMTRYGGAYNYGCIFSIDTNGIGYKDLHDFDSIHGSEPFGSLIISGKALYGVTSSGGANNYGCIFCVDTNGAGYRDMLDFNGTNGQFPVGSLTLSGNGIMYGMTENGGINGGFGVVFSIDTNGSKYKKLIDFNGSNGAWPQGSCSLTLLGGNLYGMTQYNVNGNIFTIDTNGNEFKDLYDFGFVPSATGPTGSLIFSQGKLYGMHPHQGPIPIGIAFSIDTNGGSYKELLDFEHSSLGAYPFGSLTLKGNILYGMTAFWGGGGGGSIFSLDTNGGYKELYYFNDTDGYSPWGDLTLSGNMLYGMTVYGGVYNKGVIFKIDTGARVTSSINNITVSEGAIKVYPNPSNDLFTFDFNTPVNGTIEIYNITGQKVYQQTLQSEKTEINLTGQPIGMYFYRVITETGDLIGEGKVVIQK